MAELPDAKTLLCIALYQAQGDGSGLAPCPQRGGLGVVDDLRPADQAKEKPKAACPPLIVRVDLGNTLPHAVFTPGFDLVVVHVLHFIISGARILIVPLFFSAQFAISSFQSMPISGT